MMSIYGLMFVSDLAMKCEFLFLRPVQFQPELLQPLLTGTERQYSVAPYVFSVPAWLCILDAKQRAMGRPMTMPDML
jgi:hypothetical protein